MQLVLLHNYSSACKGADFFLSMQSDPAESLTCPFRVVQEFRHHAFLTLRQELEAGHGLPKSLCYCLHDFGHPLFRFRSDSEFLSHTNTSTPNIHEHLFRFNCTMGLASLVGTSRFCVDI